MITDPTFELINSEPTKIYMDAIEEHKKRTGEELPDAHKTAYIYATVATLLSIIKAEMNQVAIQNFLPYAKNIRLDLKGAFYGSRGNRLQPNQARTTMRCYISTTVLKDVIVPKGTRFIYKNYIFFSENEFKILQGELFIDIQVVCETAGNLETILVGEITEIVDRYEYYDSVENVTNVTGGRDTEYDENYRKRLSLLPESFTSAGSGGAYEYWILQASSLVTDVLVLSPTENVLNIYVANGTNTISAEEKAAILNFITDDKLKALNDDITILDPGIYEYILNIEFWIYNDAKDAISTIQSNLFDALTEFTITLKMGSSLNRQDIINICKNNKNVKRINILSPTEDTTTTTTTLCKCTSISLHFRGSEVR